MGRRVFIDFIPTGGLNTTYNPEILDGQFLKVCRNMDTYDEFVSLGVIPGSSRVSEQAPSAWEWIHYFEFINLDGTLIRKVVGLAGTDLYQIDLDGTLNLISGGFVAEPAWAQNYNNRCFISSSDNDPVKWDGHQFSGWGVEAPSETQSALTLVTSSGDFTPNLTNTVTGGTSWRGTDKASVKLTKLDTSSTDASMSNAAADLVVKATQYFWCYIPSGVFATLNDTDAISFTQRQAAPLHQGTWTYDIGELAPGWNLLNASLEDQTVAALPIAVGDAVNVTTFKFSTTGATDVSTAFGEPIEVTFDDVVYFEDGPVATLGVAGLLTGQTHTYRVVYLTSSGQLSNAGPISNAVTPTLQTVDVTLPISSDPTVIARRIYRDEGGTTLHDFLDVVNDNTTTTYSDNILGPLANSVLPLAADEFNDNSKPPKMLAVMTWNQMIFGINAQNQSQLIITQPTEPESAPLLYRMSFDDSLTNLQRSSRGLIIFATDRSYLLDGASPATVVSREIESSVGCSGPRAAASSQQYTMAWHDDGPYIHNGSGSYYYGGFILDQVNDMDPEEFENIHVVDARSRFQIVHFAKTSTGDYDKIVSWVYGTQDRGSVTALGVGIDSLDPRTGQWTEIDLPPTINPKCSTIVETTKDKPELWMGCDDGYIYRLFDEDKYAFATAGNPYVVGSEFEPTPGPVSKEDTNITGDPRSLNLAGTCSGASAIWVAVVKTYSGPQGKVLDTRTFNVNVPLGDFDIVTPVPGDGMVRGSWVSVNLSASSTVSRTLFRKVRVTVTPGRYRGDRTQ